MNPTDQPTPTPEPRQIFPTPGSIEWDEFIEQNELGLELHLINVLRERDAFKQKAAYSERRFVRCVLKAQEAFERHASQGHACDFRTAIQSIKDSLRDHEIADTEFGKLKAERDAAIAEREKLREQVVDVLEELAKTVKLGPGIEEVVYGHKTRAIAQALLSALKP